MFFRSIRLGRIAGIPIHVDASWIIIFFIVSATLTFGQFRPLYPSLPAGVLITYGLVTALLFFLSVLLHELAHSMVARAFGIPVRNITLFMLGGVSQIEAEASRPSREFAIAIAGPLCSAALAVLAALVWMLLPRERGPLVTVVEAMAGVNLVLALFNLIPGYPLDGGRVFRSALWRVTGNHARSTQVAAAVGVVIAYSFIAGGVSLSVLWSSEFIANGLWLILIGWFLQRVSFQSYRYETLRAALRGRTVRQVMDAAPVRIGPQAPLAGLNGAGAALVADDGDDTPHGVISLRRALTARRNRRAPSTVAEAMTPMHRILRFSPDADALAALEHLDTAGADAAAVIEDGRVVGLLSRDGIQLRGTGLFDQRRAA